MCQSDGGFFSRLLKLKMFCHESSRSNSVIPNARPIAGDLETSFADNMRDSLQESGVPARAPQKLRLAGMTLVGGHAQ